MVENVIQIKSRIMINVNLSAKIQEKMKCVKKIIIGILVILVTKTDPTKIIPKNFNKKSNLLKRKIMFYSPFY